MHNYYTKLLCDTSRITTTHSYSSTKWTWQRIDGVHDRACIGQYNHVQAPNKVDSVQSKLNVEYI